MMCPEEAGADTASLRLNATSHVLYVPSYPSMSPHNLCPPVLYVPSPLTPSSSRLPLHLFPLTPHPSPLTPTLTPHPSPLTPHPPPPTTPPLSPPLHLPHIRYSIMSSSVMMRPGGEGADTASLRLNATTHPMSPYPSPLPHHIKVRCDE